MKAGETVRSRAHKENMALWSIKQFVFWKP